MSTSSTLEDYEEKGLLSPSPSSSSSLGGWNGYRLTSVFSSNFSTGAGVRLFCHQSNETATWLQELIYIQANDTWTYGARILGVSHDAHLTALIEPASHALRIFYSTGANGTDIGEAWTNISARAPATYRPGITVSNLLAHPHASFAAVALSNETYIYYSALDQVGNVSVNEVQLPLQSGLEPNLAMAVEGMPRALVARPDLRANDTQQGGAAENSSVFVPLGATVSPEGDKIVLVYPEGVVDARSGYAELKSVWRDVGQEWSVGANEEGVPMGS